MHMPFCRQCMAVGKVVVDGRLRDLFFAFWTVVLSFFSRFRKRIPVHLLFQAATAFLRLILCLVTAGEITLHAHGCAQSPTVEGAWFLLPCSWPDREVELLLNRVPQRE